MANRKDIEKESPDSGATEAKVLRRKAAKLRDAGRDAQATTIEDAAAKCEAPATYGPCPRCGEEKYRTDREVMNALSRRDNKTYICSNCGTEEALLDFVRANQTLPHSQHTENPDLGFPAELARWKTPPQSIRAALEKETP